MDISIGLPNTLAHPGPLMADWARRAEGRGFTSLATIDRIVYPSYDSLMSLAVAAGATSRIGLLSGVLLAPLHPPAWLAKAAASLDAMSGGRLTLGLGVGSRADDYAAVGRDLSSRGKDLDAALDVMRRVWAGQKVTDADAFPVAPLPGRPGGVRVVMGGVSDAAVRRTAAHAAGWLGAGLPPDALAGFAGRLRAAWQDAGREGAPWIGAMAYFGLGDAEAGRAALRTYYGFAGPWAEQVAASVLTTPQALQGARAAYADAGVDELVLVPTVASIDEVDRLADVVLT